MSKSRSKALAICSMIVIFLHCFPCITEASHILYEELQNVAPNVVNAKLRPSYHFHPSHNWMNDPNAPMFYNGVYHLFYQWNPAGAVWGNIRWAHSVSTDLINWKTLELAITPTDSFDINGCWSGSATILHGNKPAILYTGINPKNQQVQNIAFPHNLSDPNLEHWYKPNYNPVIPPDDSINASAFRDPTTAWFEDGHWKLVVGSKRRMRGLAILYRSKDFLYWVKAQHPLHSTDNTGMLECLDFFPVGVKERKGFETSVNGPNVKHVLKASLDLTRFDYYTVGTYNKEHDRYYPDEGSIDNRTGLRYDYGNFYASKTFFDPVKQRRILWGWANESDSVQQDMQKGWAGVQTIPRSLWYDRKSRQLVQWPVEELNTLRGKYVRISRKKIQSDSHFEVKGIYSAEADVEVTFIVPNLEKAEEFDPFYSTDAEALCAIKTAHVKGGIGPFGLFVMASSNLRERTAVFFRIFKDKDKHVVLMCSDPTRSTLDREDKIYKPTFAGFVNIDIEKTRKIHLRTLIDNSVVESFGAKGKTCITSRVYPTQAVGKDAHLFVFNYGAEEVHVPQLQAWEMKRPLMN